MSETKGIWSIYGADGNHRRKWHCAVRASTKERAIECGKAHPNKPKWVKVVWASPMNFATDPFFRPILSSSWVRRVATTDN